MSWTREAWRDRNDQDPKVRASNRALLASLVLFGVLCVLLALNVLLLLGGRV